MTAGARDIVVRCPAEGHRVRLAGGLRFWARAYCPRCRVAVDPGRLQRVLAWLGGLRRPVFRGLAARGTWLAAALYLGGALAAAGLAWGLGDRWWPATTLLFGPRWTLLLPLPVLVLAAVAFDRALLVPLAVAGLVILGPVMGLRTGWRGLLVPDRPAEDIRVVSFNVRGGEGLAVSPAELMLEWDADVAALQECGSALRTRIRALPDWSTDAHGSLCLVSRFAIVDVRPMERRVFQAAGGSALVVTWTLEDDDGGLFHVTNVHLETPRAGLELIRAGRIPEGVAILRQKSFLRTAELRRARSWVDALSGPRLVVGDFNTPPESRAYRDAWGDWQNAFSRAGVGLGGTRLNGWIRTRIDHVLADDAWRVAGARLGRDVGSDHLPMMADVRLR